MFRQKLHIIRIYCHFVRHLIRQVLLYPLWKMMSNNKDKSDLVFNVIYDLEFPILVKMEVNDYPKHRMSPKVTANPHTPDYYSDPLHITHSVLGFSYQARIYSRRYNNKYRLMRRCLAHKTKSFFKRWNDDMNYHLTLLFGLSNIRPANLYDAIFGSSSYRIH